MLVVLLLILATCLTYILFRKGHSNKDYFAGGRIKYSKPKFIFGHSRDMMFRKKDYYEFIKSVYSEFPNEKANGLWDMRTPMVLIRDLELLKQISIKDFDHFTDHKVIFDGEMDPLVGNTLVALTGQKWREMRVTLSPAFTGSKMRSMFRLVTEVTSQMTRYLVERCEEDKSPVLEYDMKDLCSKFTSDVIAMCAFGIQVDTHRNPSNQFYNTGSTLMNPSFLTIVKFLAFRFTPWLTKLLKVNLLTPSCKRFFCSMVLETMENREKHQIIRPDMIHLLMEAKKGTLRHQVDVKGDESEPSKNGQQWSDDEIVAQCLMFFLAGLETSSSVMAVAAYEIVLNPEVQQKLFEEVSATQDQLHTSEGSGELSYETLRGMKYLDMVVNETLRKWPPAPVTDRVCGKQFHYEDKDTGLRLNFEKGSQLWIPIYGFHTDPELFPEPDKFYPERFSEENRHMVTPDAFIPFGIGPRSCIANRFALMEVKALLYHLVLNFELVVSEKTNVPLKVTNNFGAIAKDIFIGLKKRKN